MTKHKTSTSCIRGAWLLSGLLLVGTTDVLADSPVGWIDQGGDRGGSRFSALAQINRDNVDTLQHAWTFRTGAGDGAIEDIGHAGLQATPILLPEEAGGLLVFCSPFNVVIALDPVSGRERWRFDPKIKRGSDAAQYKCRGVAQWQDAAAEVDGACEWRIFLTTHDRRLYALDARTGKSCVGFGDLGLVRLSPLIKAATPAVTTATVQTFMPPVIVRGTVVVGTSTGVRYRRADAPSGTVWAFDARSGELRWSFDPLSNSPGTDDRDDQAPVITGGVNVSSLMSVDEERDLVFLTTSGASPQFFGGTRPGNNALANSTIALQGSTGELVWSFQTVHHDVWGRDAGSQPVLVEIDRGNQRIPAIVQLTSHGFTFVLHRETGKPLFPVEEREVSTAGVEGEFLAPTQPFPTAPPPLSATRLGPDNAWGFTFYDQGVCRKNLTRYPGGDVFAPPSVEGTLVMPGEVSSWGSGAYDAARSLFITNAQNFPMFMRLVPREEVDSELADSPFAGLPDGPPGLIKGTPYAVERGSEKLLSPLRVPCTKPPWHSLIAIDLKKGNIAWSVPLGSLEKTAGLPLELGAPGVGGPIATAGGIVFIAATADEMFRAFDIESGKKLWEIELPTAGMATPMTYEAGGRQFIVIAAGGHPDYYPGKIGDYLIAFALPD